MLSDDMHKAAEYAHAAVSSMTKHRIPPTPENYAVWYEYYAGREPELMRAVDALLATGAQITASSVTKLYERHLNPARLQAEAGATTKQLEKLLGKVRTQIGSAEESSRAYGQSLENISGQIDGDHAPAQLNGLVAALLQETRQMQARNRSLETELARSTAEVTQLRVSFEQARRDSLTDPLTGLANRKRFDAALDLLVRTTVERNDTLSLLILDIDHFKRVNDTYGHQAGDAVLQMVGRALRDNTKGHDVAARYGGEEFAVLLPFTKLEQAYSLGNTIRTVIGNLVIRHPDTGTPLDAVTISVGAAQYRRGESLPQFIQRADDALYAAKSGGRNRVVADSRHIGPASAAS